MLAPCTQNPSRPGPLFSPVAIAPIPPMSRTERKRLTSLLISHRREVDNLLQQISHLEGQLAAR